MPTSNSVYRFLEHSHLRGLSSYSEVAIPTTRLNIAKYILEISKNDRLLSNIEKEHLKFFEDEYTAEFIQLGELSDTCFSSHELYSYKDTLFHLELSPRVGGFISDGLFKRWIGVQLFGSISKTLGYSFIFADNVEKGLNINYNTKLTPYHKKNVMWSQNNNKEISYSYTYCNIAADFDWFRFGVGQDNFEWGSGYSGKLIFTSKPTPFPFLRMEFRPTDWLGLYYIHGWLKSNVIDTLASYKSLVDGMTRNIYRDKYIASHILDLKITKDIEVAFGESIIYSDGAPKLIFLIPINFFRAADHYLTTEGKIGDGNNSQFFGDIQYWGLKNTKLYGSVFIDEIDINNILSTNSSRNQVGWTLGARTTGWISDDIDITLEFTRILPWVYSNFTQTQTYENDGDVLGYYIGDNCDKLYFEISWHPLYNLHVLAYYDYLRKGGKADISYQYKLPSLPFLYGSVKRSASKGFSVEFIPYHNIILRADYIDGDKRLLGENSSWRLLLQYGY